MALRELDRIYNNPTIDEVEHLEIRDIPKKPGKEVVGHVKYTLKLQKVPVNKEEEFFIRFIEASYSVPGFTKKQENALKKSLREDRKPIQYVVEDMNNEALKKLGLIKTIRFPISAISQRKANEIIGEVNRIFEISDF
jgi:hypothetical protein